MRGYTAVAKWPEEGLQVQLAGGVPLSPELIEEYLKTLLETGCAVETVKNYRMKLNQLYQYLPEEKCVRPGTLEEWRSTLLEAGYSVSTINGCTAAANGLMIHCGHRELLVEKPLKYEHGVQPELTRNEYLRLLSAARSLGKEREYLLIKLFGSTGLMLRDLPRLTVEAVHERAIMVPAALHIPNCLWEELEGYVCRAGIIFGPLFVTRDGKPIGRNNITRMVQSVSRDARVAEEKATPRCLKKLYQATWAAIQSDIARLVEQTYDRLMETEQLSIAWSPETDDGGS